MSISQFINKVNPRLCRRPLSEQTSAHACPAAAAAGQAEYGIRDNTSPLQKNSAPPRRNRHSDTPCPFSPHTRRTEQVFASCAPHKTGFRLMRAALNRFSPMRAVQNRFSPHTRRTEQVFASCAPHEISFRLIHAARNRFSPHALRTKQVFASCTPSKTSFRRCAPSPPYVQRGRRSAAMTSS